MCACVHACVSESMLCHGQLIGQDVSAGLTCNRVDHTACGMALCSSSGCVDAGPGFGATALSPTFTATRTQELLTSLELAAFPPKLAPFGTMAVPLARSPKCRFPLQTLLLSRSCRGVAHRVQKQAPALRTAACCPNAHASDLQTALYTGSAAPAVYWGPLAAANVHGKGRGLVATRDIQPGELLMSCRPLVFMECEEGDVPSMEALCAL
jgi:hypothetical protein